MALLPRPIGFTPHGLDHLKKWPIRCRISKTVKFIRIGVLLTLYKHGPQVPFFSLSLCPGAHTPHAGPALRACVH